LKGKIIRSPDKVKKELSDLKIELSKIMEDVKDGEARYAEISKKKNVAEELEKVSS
jgi:predicted  nucleic acid-binding Zn-ribbon protein